MAASAGRPTGTSRCLLPFAGDAEDAEVGFEVGHAQTAQLRDPQSGGVEQFQHGVIAEPVGPGLVGRGDQRVDLLPVEELGDVLPLLGSGDVLGGVDFDSGFLQKEAVVAADTGQMTGYRAAGEPGAV